MEFKIKFIIAALALMIFPACSHQGYVESLKLIAFSEDLSSGQKLKELSGKDCSWSVFGYNFGPPKIDRALIQAIRESGQPIRYLNNVRTKNYGWNLFIISKECVDVKGEAFL